jgi:uncharacterized membrane protein
MIAWVIAWAVMVVVAMVVGVSRQPRGCWRGGLLVAARDWKLVLVAVVAWVVVALTPWAVFDPMRVALFYL